MKIIKAPKRLNVPFTTDGVKFGHKYSPHMFKADFVHDDNQDKWLLKGDPVIKPLTRLEIHPGAKVGLNFKETSFQLILKHIQVLEFLSTFLDYLFVNLKSALNFVRRFYIMQTPCLKG